jgi:hypothetical protein
VEASVIKVGSESWRFEKSIDELPHVALYVRDALRLEIDNEETDPPRLAGDIADRSDWLDETTRRDAAREWPAWWDAIIGPVAEAPSLPEGGSASGRQRASRHIQYLDPPFWDSLTDHPALRQALTAAFDEASRFAEDLRRRVITESPRPSPDFPYEVIRRAAEAVAAAAGVSLGVLDASASVIYVEGSWWRVPRRGELLSSIGAARDPDQAYRALTAVFMSVV